MELPVVRTIEEAKKVDPKQRVLIEVPGRVAREMLWLANMLTQPDQSEAGQLVTQLFSRFRPTGQKRG